MLTKIDVLYSEFSKSGKNMYLTTRSSVAFVALLAFLPSFADEIPVKIKTNFTGDYFIVEQGGTANNPVLVVKRKAPNYTHYTKRVFDCEDYTSRYLGEGESLDEMAKSEPEPEMRAIREGSISDQLARYVCPRQESAEMESSPPTNAAKIDSAQPSTVGDGAENAK